MMGRDKWIAARKAAAAVTPTPALAEVRLIVATDGSVTVEVRGTGLWTAGALPSIEIGGESVLQLRPLGEHVLRGWLKHLPKNDEVRLQMGGLELRGQVSKVEEAPSN